MQRLKMRLLLLLAILVPMALLGETYQITPDHYYRTFAHNNPVFQSIKSGDVIVTKTLDSGGQDYRGEHRSEPGISF